MSGIKRRGLLKGGVQSLLPGPDFHALPTPTGPRAWAGQGRWQGAALGLVLCPGSDSGFCDLGGGTPALRAGCRGLGWQQLRWANADGPVPPAASRLRARAEHADSGTAGLSTPLPGTVVPSDLRREWPQGQREAGPSQPQAWQLLGFIRHHGGAADAGALVGTCLGPREHTRASQPVIHRVS